MLQLYNTLTRKIELFKPLNPPVVTYYSCGPTVYDYAHIGHARTYVFADILQRVLEFSGYKVKRVMNITDVGHLTSDSDTGEDKMEKGATREKKTVWELAKYYTDDFFKMLKILNIKRPEFIPKATDYIASMIYIIEALERRGYTYLIADGVYFDTSKFPTYGQLTGQTLFDLQKTLKAGARVDVVPGKKQPMDFALWKLTPPGVERQMEWDSPWGKGFPGWHIECSAMSMGILGETIDIHTGGVDHIPIHHTNEIAQSEAATGKQFVRFWLHGEHLLVNGEKMSKSLGNFYRVSDNEKEGYSPLALRYLFLNAHYRTQMNFTRKALAGAQKALEGLYNEISNIKYPAFAAASAGRQISNNAIKEKKKNDKEKIKLLKQQFTEAVQDDLNTAKGLAVVWEVVRSNIPPKDKYDLFLLFDEVLGLGLEKIKVKSQKVKVPEEIKQLVAEREKLRKEKKWAEADKLRKVIEKKGFAVEDSSTGPEVKNMHEKAVGN